MSRERFGFPHGTLRLERLGLVNHKGLISHIISKNVAGK